MLQGCWCHIAVIWWRGCRISGKVWWLGDGLMWLNIFDTRLRTHISVCINITGRSYRWHGDGFIWRIVLDARMRMRIIVSIDVRCGAARWSGLSTIKTTTRNFTVCQKLAWITKIMSVNACRILEFDHFNARQHMLSALYAIARPSVRLSVCPSVNEYGEWKCVRVILNADQSKTVEVRIMQFSPYSCPSLSCSWYKFHSEIPTGSP